MSVILKRVGDIIVSATTQPCVAKDRFVVNMNTNIIDIGNYFTHWFLSGDGKIEEPIGEQTLYCHELRKSKETFMFDGAIIDGLGGETKVETTLAEMLFFMENWEHSKSSEVFPKNGEAYLFYIKDKDGVLRTVNVDRFGDDWRVLAFSVGDARWYEGYRVLSHNSALGPSEPLVSAA